MAEGIIRLPLLSEVFFVFVQYKSNFVNMMYHTTTAVADVNYTSFDLWFAQVPLSGSTRLWRESLVDVRLHLSYPVSWSSPRLHRRHAQSASSCLLRPQRKTAILPCPSDRIAIGAMGGFFEPARGTRTDLLATSPSALRSSSYSTPPSRMNTIGYRRCFPLWANKSKLVSTKIL